MSESGTTPSPVAALEQVLYDHGDNLYRLALLLAENERQAVRALQAVARHLTRPGEPAFTPDLAEIVSVLLTTIRQQAERAAPARRRRLRLPSFRSPATTSISDELYQAMRRLPREQRQVLGLCLLMGYSIPLVARISGTDEEQAHTLFQEALAALAPAAAIDLSIARPTEQCQAVRWTLTRTPAHLPHDQDLRGHLAIGRACRTFEHAWQNLVRQIEGSIRAVLRERTLPEDRITSLLERGRSRHTLLHNPLFRATLFPVLVLLLIVSLVLPGFFQRPMRQQPETSEAVDPHTLVEQAVANYFALPPRQGVWHTQWELLWYFSDGSLAPLLGEVWIDAQNPARHRIQLTHRDGGAPYELQLGDGDRHLWYALHPAYYGSLYGGMQLITSPRLVHRAMESEDQDAARQARFSLGAWYIGMAYLRQAEQAAEVRTLGQQRIGDHTVQVISFAGISPLARPPDTLDEPQRKITILLALDIADGRLRSATEVLGHSGDTGSSRITWRLRREEWLGGMEQIRAVFDIEQAWIGKGDFAPQPGGHSADPALLLYAQDEIESPERLLEHYDDLWLPAKPPPGSEHALLRWPAPMVVYRGQGRWLTVLASTPPAISRDAVTFTDPARLGGIESGNTERTQVGPWTVVLRTGNGRRFWAVAQREIIAGDAAAAIGREKILIDASGYSRAELFEVIRSLQPFDRQSLRAHEHLFPATPGTDAGAQTHASRP